MPTCPSDLAISSSSPVPRLIGDFVQRKLGQPDAVDRLVHDVIGDDAGDVSTTDTRRWCRRWSSPLEEDNLAARIILRRGVPFTCVMLGTRWPSVVSGVSFRMYSGTLRRPAEPGGDDVVDDGIDKPPQVSVAAMRKQRHARQERP